MESRGIAGVAGGAALLAAAGIGAATGTGCAATGTGFGGATLGSAAFVLLCVARAVWIRPGPTRRSCPCATISSTEAAVCSAAARRAPLHAEQNLHEHQRKIVHIAAARFQAGFALTRFADAVAAQPDAFADSEDGARLDVFVNEAVGMQGLKSRGDAQADLGGIRRGEAAPLQHLSQVCVDALEDGIDGRDVVFLNAKLTEAVDAEEVGMAKGLNAAPSSQNLILVEVALDDAGMRNSFANLR